MNRFKYAINSNWKSIVGAILVVALCIGIVSAVISIDSSDTKEISSSEFTIGSISTQTGKYVEDNQAIYTENVFECFGLRIEPEFKFGGNYDVIYYDDDLNFYKAETGITGVYTDTYPEVKYCRVVIHPLISEDESEDDYKIYFWDVRGIANDLEITVAKNSKYKTSNLYIDANAQYGYTLSALDEIGGNLHFNIGDSVEPLPCFETGKVSEYITLDQGFQRYDIFVKDVDHAVYGVVVHGGQVVLNDTAKQYEMDPEGWVKMSFDISDVEAIVTLELLVAMHKDSLCRIYAY